MGASDDTLQAGRMTLLGRVRDFRTRFGLLFPHPTPEVRERHGDALDHLERWLDGSDTLAAWFEHWLPNIAARRVRPRTLASYESIVRMHITPYVGGQRLDRLQPEHLEQLYNTLLEQGLSPTTVLRVHRIVSRALKVAMQRARVHRNVATLVDPPAQRESGVATALTLEEATAVLHAARGQRNAARWTVALALGLRQSEALALQWKDIDLLNGTLSVHRTIHRVKGKGLVYEPPKTRRSQRTIALPAPLVAALHEHKRRQLGERMLAANEWHDEDLVFTQPNGRPIDKKADYDAWSDLLRTASVRHVRLHDGRHTAATLLAVRGRSPARGDGTAGPLADAHHDGYLQPRHAGAGPRGSRADGRHPAQRVSARLLSATNCNQSNRR